MLHHCLLNLIFSVCESDLAAEEFVETSSSSFRPPDDRSVKLKSQDIK